MCTEWISFKDAFNDKWMDNCCGCHRNVGLEHNSKRCYSCGGWECFWCGSCLCNKQIIWPYLKGTRAVTFYCECGRRYDGRALIRPNNKIIKVYYPEEIKPDFRRKDWPKMVSEKRSIAVERCTVCIQEDTD